MLKQRTFCPLPLYNHKQARAHSHTKSTANTYAHIKIKITKKKKQATCIHNTHITHKFVPKSSPPSFCHRHLFYQFIPSSFIHLPNLSMPLSDTFDSHILPLRWALFSCTPTPFMRILFPHTPIHPPALDYFENVSCPPSFPFLSLSPSTPLLIFFLSCLLSCGFNALWKWTGAMKAKQDKFGCLMWLLSLLICLIGGMHLCVCLLTAM